MSVVNVYSTSVTTENISRFELLAWVNDSLQSNFSKIEEMSTAAAYCQLTDLLFPGYVPMKKVKWNSRLDVDWINNWRILQAAWKAIGIDKPVPVQMLMKGKFQDNFEFLQWFRKFYDANYVERDYNPLKARNNEDLPANSSTSAKKPMRTSTTARPAPPSAPTANRTMGASTTSAGGRVSTATAAAPSPRRSFAPVVSAKTLRRSILPTQSIADGEKASAFSTGARLAATFAAAEELKKLKAENSALRTTINELNQEVTELKNNGEIYQRESTFYYGKLRAIELICQKFPDEGAMIPASEIMNILYIKDEDSSEHGSLVRSVASSLSMSTAEVSASLNGHEATPFIPDHEEHGDVQPLVVVNESDKSSGRHDLTFTAGGEGAENSISVLDSTFDVSSGNLNATYTAASESHNTTFNTGDDLLFPNDDALFGEILAVTTGKPTDAGEDAILDVSEQEMKSNDDDIDAAIASLSHDTMTETQTAADVPSDKEDAHTKDYADNEPRIITDAHSDLAEKKDTEAKPSAEVTKTPPTPTTKSEHTAAGDFANDSTANDSLLIFNLPSPPPAGVGLLQLDDSETF